MVPLTTGGPKGDGDGDGDGDGARLAALVYLVYLVGAQGEQAEEVQLDGGVDLQVAGDQAVVGLRQHVLLNSYCSGPLKS
ncbi:MAG: hypothetical protein U5L74_02720 [Ideonella sp.]|nr:hypothetical protein [Ideonella sp.]